MIRVWLKMHYENTHLQDQQNLEASAFALVSHRCWGKHLLEIFRRSKQNKSRASLEEASTLYPLFNAKMPDRGLGFYWSSGRISGDQISSNTEIIDEIVFKSFFTRWTWSHEGTPVQHLGVSEWFWETFCKNGLWHLTLLTKKINVIALKFNWRKGRLFT